MKVSAARMRYANDSKDSARLFLAQHVALHKPESILDLYGGGASATLFRQVAPTAAMTVAESDPDLWPALRQDAQQQGYAFHLGRFEEAQGRYDFINLDLCSQWSGSAREAVVSAARMLTKSGSLAVTLMRAREAQEIAADRWFVVPASLERASGRVVQLLFPYQSGVPMWTFVLTPGVNSVYMRRGLTHLDLMDDSPFDATSSVRQSIEEVGYYGWDFCAERVCTLCGKPEEARLKRHRCGCPAPVWSLVVEDPRERQAVAA